MGLREILQKRKNLSVGLAFGLIVLGVGTICWQLASANRDTRFDIPNEFFTVDDGQTFFSAKATNVAPFDYKGKTAVKAAVYECGGKRFVAYVERYKPEARTVMAAMATAAATAAPDAKSGGNSRGGPAPNPGAVREASMNGREIKRPGDKDWIPSTNRQKVAEIQNNVTCPGGGPGRPTPVEP
jgi:hypothetical protein